MKKIILCLAAAIAATTIIALAISWGVKKKTETDIRVKEAQMSIVDLRWNFRKTVTKKCVVKDGKLDCGENLAPIIAERDRVLREKNCMVIDSKWEAIPVKRAEGDIIIALTPIRISCY